MSIRRKGNGWIIDTRWPDGMRTRKRMPDRATAEKINKKIEVACADEVRIWKKLRVELGLESGGALTFAGLAKRYLDQYVRQYNRAIRYKEIMIGFMIDDFGGRPAGIDQPTANAFFSRLRAKGLKPASINRYIATLRHMMSWAVDQGILDVDPLARLKKMRELEWVGERPDDGKIDAIFANIDPRALPIFVFIRETGCRRGEAVSLRHDQIDFVRRIVTFTGDTKSGRSRQVPLTDAALKAISDMPANGSHIFYHPNTLNPWRGDTLLHTWERARGKSKLRIHDLRHAYAIRLAESGCAMHYISEMLGHLSGVDFTHHRYARFSPESATRAVLYALEGHKTGTDN